MKQLSAQTPSTTPFFKAIVIGVSAGGMEALMSIIPKLPEDFNCPIIIVQHRSASEDDFLVEYFNRNSKIEVLEAKSNDRIEPNKIYFAPGGYHLMVEEDFSFSLSLDIPVNYAIPSIDLFFESAALAYKKKLIGVVLTGANSDGAKGLKVITDFKGIAIVEDPQTANTPTMPQSALNETPANYVLKKEEIADTLIELCGSIEKIRERG